MTTAYDVAAYILAKRGRTPAVKLHKLLYYAQARSLVWDDRDDRARPPVSGESHRRNATASRGREAPVARGRTSAGRRSTDLQESAQFFAANSWNRVP